MTKVERGVYEICLSKAEGLEFDAREMRDRYRNGSGARKLFAESREWRAAARKFRAAVGSTTKG